MQATQSKNASDLLHPDTTDQGSAHAGTARTRELPSAFSTPIFLGPIQAARKYMERQRSGGSLTEAAKDGIRAGTTDPGDSSVSIAGLHGREQANREQANREQANREQANREQANREQASREQDRRLERSLYEGHSIEAGLNYETESGPEIAGSAANRRAFLAKGDGTERLFPYPEPYPDSSAAVATAPNPDAVRGAILRLARESRPMLDSLAGAATVSQSHSVQDHSAQDHAATGQAVSAAGQATLAVRQMETQADSPDGPAAGLPFAATRRSSTSPQIDPPALPASPAFAEVARRVWARQSVENGTAEASVADGVAAGALAAGALKDGLAARKPKDAAANAMDSTAEGVAFAAPEFAASAFAAEEFAAGEFAAEDLPFVAHAAPADRDPPGARQDPPASPPVSANQQEANAAAVLPLPPTVKQESIVLGGTARPGGEFEDAALAHDACNLLSALGLYSDLLNFPGVLEEPHRHYAEELKLIAARSQLLIDRLLRLRDGPDPSPKRTASGAPGTFGSRVADPVADLHTSDLEPLGRDALGLDTLGRDTPGLDTPGLDTPGLDTPGLDTPGLDTPGLDTPGLDTPGLDTPGLDTRDPGTRERETSRITRTCPDPSVTPPPDGLRLVSLRVVPLPPANSIALAGDQQNAGRQSATRSAPVAVPPLIAHAQTIPWQVSPGVAALSADRTVSLDENRQAGGESTIATAQVAGPLGIDRQATHLQVSEAVRSEPRQNRAPDNDPRTLENEARAGRNEVQAEDAPRATASRSSGSPASEAWPTSLVDLLMRWGSLLSTLAHGRLDVSFGPQAASPVAVAAESLERILVNLVKNARAATINGGAIRIGVGVCDAEPVPASAQTASSEFGSHAGSSAVGIAQRSVVLTVDDSGCGMSETEVVDILAIEQIAEVHILSGVDPWRVTASGNDVRQLVPSHRTAGVRAPEVTLGDTQAGSSRENLSNASLDLEAGRAATGSMYTAAPASSGAASRGSTQGRGLGLRVVKGLVAETGGTLAIHSRLGRGTRIEIRWPSAGPVPAVAKPGTPRPAAALAERADIPIQPDTAPASSFGPLSTLAGSPAEPAAIGPDGFSEDELRSMMLRLHRTVPSGQGQAQDLLERRRGAQETSGSSGPAGTRPGIESGPRSAAAPVARDRFVPDRVTADRPGTDRPGTGISPANIWPANTDTEITRPEITRAEITRLESTRLESSRLESKGAIAC